MTDTKGAAWESSNVFFVALVLTERCGCITWLLTIPVKRLLCNVAPITGVSEIAM
jgi:hypothetical protein